MNNERPEMQRRERRDRDMPPRDNEDIRPTSNRLFVSNINKDLTNFELQVYFFLFRKYFQKLEI
jgi:hypothetical protein